MKVGPEPNQDRFLQKPMNTQMLTRSFGLALLLTAVASTSAQTVRGPNGHFYQLVSSPGITWGDAKAAAESSLRCGQPGHLVTITSQTEQDFIVASFGGVRPPAEALLTKWIGAFQANSSDGTGGWAWVTGEPFDYTNWSPGEPNNGNYGAGYGYEDAGNFWGYDGGWNDAPSGWDQYGGYGGYLVEWDVDATVIIDGCDTGVANAVVDETTLCTISDLIAECAAGATNHGDFVSCVAKLTNSLRKAGVITGAEKGLIQSCAAQAAIP